MCVRCVRLHTLSIRDFVYLLQCNVYFRSAYIICALNRFIWFRLLQVCARMRFCVFYFVDLIIFVSHWSWAFGFSVLHSFRFGFVCVPCFVCCILLCVSLEWWLFVGYFSMVVASFFVAGREQIRCSFSISVATFEFMRVFEAMWMHFYIRNWTNEQNTAHTLDALTKFRESQRGKTHCNLNAK